MWARYRYVVMDIRSKLVQWVRCSNHGHETPMTKEFPAPRLVLGNWVCLGGGTGWPGIGMMWLGEACVFCGTTFLWVAAQKRLSKHKGFWNNQRWLKRILRQTKSNQIMRHFKVAGNSNYCKTDQYHQLTLIHWVVPLDFNKNLFELLTQIFALFIFIRICIFVPD